MTIPYLMNCSHNPDGWCLRCVQDQQHEIDRLRGVNAEMLAACEAVQGQIDYLRNLWGDEGITRRISDQLKGAIAKATQPLES